MSIYRDFKLQYSIGGAAEKMIYWNIGAFLLSVVFFYQFSTGDFIYPDWLALVSDPSKALVFPWTLITYGFLHGGFLHIFFNMLVLNFSSRLFLTFFTQKQFLGVYFLGMLFCGLVFLLSHYIFIAPNVQIVGASGAIMAILMAATTYNPLMDIRLLLIGKVKLWHLTAVILILDLLQVRLDNTGGHIAHLSGALFGFTYVKILQNGTDMSKIVSSLIDFFGNLFKPKPKTPFKKVHKNYQQPAVSRVSKIVTKDKTQQQIDEILDKISQSGYDSLTASEKEFLFKAGK